MYFVYLPSCYNYRPPSCNIHRHAHIIISKFEKAPLVAYRPPIAIAYHFHQLQTLCNYCFLFTITLPSLQTSNFMFTWLLLFDGNYHHVAECIFYSNSKYKNIFIVKEKNNQTKK